MVHQELAFCDKHDRRGESVPRLHPDAVSASWDDAEMDRRATALLAETGTTLDVRRRFGELSIGHRQMVQIAAAVGRRRPRHRVRRADEQPESGGGGAAVTR